MEKLITFLKGLWATVVAFSALILFLQVAYVGWTVEDPSNKDLSNMIVRSLMVVLVAIWTNGPSEKK